MLNRSPGEELLNRLQKLAECSEPGPGLTRLPFTPQHDQARELISSWMHQAGLNVRLDAAGTLIGRKNGPDGAPTLAMGSHQDSIRHGGMFDGMLGIALPILVLEGLKEYELPFSVEVMAFADEEGVRFPTALMGPRAIAGTFDLDCLELKDRDGISLKKALNDFGCQAEEIPQLVRKPEEFLGFVEIHIEQGPVLEDMERGLGVVTSICGIERWKVSLFGKAGHAGTTPMELRKDALAGAAEVALEVEKVCRATQGAVGIVGRIETFPNVVNVIPAQVDFTIELRAGEDSVRSKISSQIANATRRIALDRQLKLDMEKTYEQKAVPCDEALSGALANAVLEVQGDAPKLMSGATHDASAMADVCPIAMLFVRCTDGLSHHPDEAMTAQDGALAIATLECFLKKLADN